MARRTLAISGLILSLAATSVAVAQTRQGSRPAISGTVQQAGPFIAFTLQAQRTKEETKGDIYLPAQWVSTMAFPARDKIRFRYTLTANADPKSTPPAEWRVYDGAPPASDIAGTAPNLVAKGSAGPTPLSAKAFTEFDVDLRGVLPPKPNNRSYHVKLAGRTSTGAYTAATSAAVVLKYEAPRGTTFTTKDLRPELWKPLAIEMRLSNITSLDAQEDGALSNGDEPYLMVFALFADGTTIKPKINIATRALEFTGSTVRLMSSTQTHGNLPLPYGHLKTGNGAVVPPAVGTFATTIVPLGLDVLDQVENTPNIPGVLTVNTQLPTPETLMANTLVALVVIALEEDESPTALADLLRQEAAARLKQKLDARLGSLVIKDPANVQQAKEAFNPEAIAALTTELKAELKAIGFEFHQTDAFNPLKIHQVADPDDRIGVQVRLFNYAQFLSAGAAGETFTILFNGDDASYRVVGAIRRK